MSIIRGLELTQGFAPNPSNIYTIAKEASNIIMTNNQTDWVEECHNYKAQIINSLERKYPNIFGTMQYDDCILVTHRKDFDILEFHFNGPFIKQVEELYPEALI